MTNGDGVPKLPGFFIGGGVGISTSAILIGGLGLLAWTWLSMQNNNRPKIAMDDETLAQQVEGDVLAYAADSHSVNENRDRIRSAINRIRDTFTAAREAYVKKIRDLAIARRKGLITNTQFHTQKMAAHIEFQAAIKARHREIMEELNIPHFASNETAIVPTLG